MAESLLNGAINNQLGNNFLLQKQMEIMLEANNRKISGELSRMNSIIEQLSMEIKDLKRNMYQQPALSESPGQVEKREEQPRMVQEPQRVQQAPVNKVNNNGAPKPRYGDYKPGDINLDNFFYFGNKKK